MNQEETIKALETEKANLKNKLAEVHGDIFAVATAGKEAFESLGLSTDDLQGGNIASIVAKVMPSIMTMDASKLQGLKSIFPILEKYQHLISE